MESQHCNYANLQHLNLIHAKIEKSWRQFSKLSEPPAMHSAGAHYLCKSRLQIKDTEFKCTYPVKDI